MRKSAARRFLRGESAVASIGIAAAAILLGAMAVLAVALFGGATLPRRIAWAVPLLAMVVSDLALGYPLGWMSAVIYACFLTAVGIGQWLRDRRTWGRTLAAALAGSVLFYAVTNFAVWLAPPLEARAESSGSVAARSAMVSSPQSASAG